MIFSTVKAYTDKKPWKEVILKYPFVKENTTGLKPLFHIFNWIYEKNDIKNELSCCTCYQNRGPQGQLGKC